MSKPKVIVIGLDGGTWNIIKPLVDAGKLPTISKIMGNGCCGELESSIPHITFPAWKCYSTGKNPGKLGVYWFLSPHFEKQKIIPNNSLSFKSMELWDYLGDQGHKSVILDMPTTYPPKKINGCMVSWGAPKQLKYTYPENLGNELEEEFDYKIDPEYFFDINKDAALESTAKLIKKRFDVAKHLINKYNPDFTHMTIFHIDSIQHVFWNGGDNSNIEGNAIIEDFWKIIDDGIKSLMDNFDDGKTYFILMSDHGFTKTKATFQLGRWLIENDYLVLKTNKRAIFSIPSKLGLNRDRLFIMINKLNLYHLIKNNVPKDIAQKILDTFFPPKEGVATHSLEGLIDWTKSKVVPLPEGPIYINKNLVSTKEYEEIRKKLVLNLEKIENPKTQEKLAKKVYKKEDLYSGPYVHNAPDIIILPNEGYEIATSPHTNILWDFFTNDRPGTHKLTGIFSLMGPDTKKGLKLNRAKLVDIAPTILHMFGVPIPHDIDGRVLTEIFREDSEMAQREIVYEEDKTKAEKNKDVLKSKIGNLKQKRKI